MTQQTLPARTPNLVWGVIDIYNMPKHLRLDVEQLFVDYLPSPGPSSEWFDETPADGPFGSELTAEWFTQWHRCPNQPGTVYCKQTLSAHPGELEELEEALARFACEQGFSASVRRY